MKVLFLGEGDLHGPARYLAAVLKWGKIPFDHLPDRKPLPSPWLKRRYDAVILSDYRYAGWTRGAREWLVRSVKHGMGLMMIGGWASFTGQVGGYSGTEIEKLMPVRCLPGDDRVNRPAILCVTKAAAVIVNGYHKVRAKPAARTLLEFQDIEFSNGRPKLGARRPALVSGIAGRGRTLAFMTDCAPHWAGGLIDWGHHRIQTPVAPGVTVETGDTYLSFMEKWIRWVGRIL